MKEEKKDIPEVIPKEELEDNSANQVVAEEKKEQMPNKTIEPAKVLTKEQQLESVEAEKQAVEQNKEEQNAKNVQTQQRVVEIKEKEEKVEVKPTENKEEPKEEKEASTFKRIMGIVLIILFIVMVFYLPEITDFIDDYKARKNPPPEIVDGVSICKLSKTSENLDIDIVATFKIINKKLQRLEYVTTSKGDKEKDKEELSKLKSDCELVKLEAGELDGITISCSLNNGIITNKQVLDYEKLDVNKVTSAYIEAGGIYTEFKKNDNIDKIEAKMKSNGYECSRRG